MIRPVVLHLLWQSRLVADLSRPLGGDTIRRREIRDWGAESLRREYEADELAALLILRGMNESAEFVFRSLAVAGPFLFLALDHIITRVQSEIYNIPDALIERTRDVGKPPASPVISS